MTGWSAEQYRKFEDERTRPASDLLARVPLAGPARVADLGCGPGNSTELLAERWPGAEIIGVDSDPDMLAAARRRLPDRSFVAADLASWQPAEPFDLLRRLEPLLEVVGSEASDDRLNFPLVHVRKSALFQVVKQLLPVGRVQIGLLERLLVRHRGS